MILYHGSNIEINQIDLSKSKPNKDFGRAFYLSANKQQAEDMAGFTVERFGGEKTITTFYFDESILSDKTMKIKSFNSYSIEWAEFVFSNRDAKSDSNIHDFDIVYGPIANDRVGRQIFNFKEGYISIDEFMNRLKFMEGITFQYAFCTKLAISKLNKI